MANHVYFNITVENLNDECKALEQALPTEECERKTWNDKVVKFKEIIEVDKLPMYKDCGQEYDSDGHQTNWYDWGCTNVGAKWISFDDFELEGNGYVNGHSAWSHPYPFCEKLCEFIANMTNKEVLIHMTYEDEFRNFFGKDLFEAHWSREYNEWHIDHHENYHEGEDLTYILSEVFKVDFNSDEEIDWWEERDCGMDEKWSIQEYADEVVYRFFDSGRLEAL